MWNIKGYFLLRDYSLIAHIESPAVAWECMDALAEKHKNSTFTLLYKDGSASKCIKKPVVDDASE